MANYEVTSINLPGALLPRYSFLVKKSIVGLVIKILIGSVLPAVPVAAAIATVTSVTFAEEAVAADTTC